MTKPQCTMQHYKRYFHRYAYSSVTPQTSSPNLTALWTQTGQVYSDDDDTVALDKQYNVMSKYKKLLNMLPRPNLFGDNLLDFWEVSLERFCQPNNMQNW